MNRRDFKPDDYLRILTSTTISAVQIAAMEDCDIRTARAIATSLSPTPHRKGTAYACPTEAYLNKYRGTSRKDELKAIYGEINR